METYSECENRKVERFIIIFIKNSNSQMEKSPKIYSSKTKFSDLHRKKKVTSEISIPVKTEDPRDSNHTNIKPVL